MMLSPAHRMPLLGSGEPKSCGRRVSFTPLSTFDSLVRNAFPFLQKSTARRS